MSRMKILLSSLLVVLALGLVASAVASAELNGPWWRHPEQGKQVKFPQNQPKQVKGINAGGFEVKTENVAIFCGEALLEGSIWNGAHQGQDQAKLQLLKCRVTRPVPCEFTPVKISQIKVYTELMWKYQGIPTELIEPGGQQKIYDAFAPTVQPNKEGRAPLATIAVPPGCFVPEQLTLWAKGSPAQYEDSQQVNHSIVWGTAAEVSPQNQDSQALILKWADPNVRFLHHQEKPVAAELQLEDETGVFEAANLQGGLRIERQQGQEEFGAFNQ
jgi:hypothetical protein